MVEYTEKVANVVPGGLQGKDFTLHFPLEGVD